MKRTRLLIAVILFLSLKTLHAEENIRKIATWNMKWLGTNSGKQLDAVENVPEYAKYIQDTEATLFALQEIAGTHSEDGQPRCHYLDLVVNALNADIADESDKWAYVLDSDNGQQRLAYLYKQDLWSVYDTYTVYPGSS